MQKLGALAALVVATYALPPSDMPLNRKEALARIKGGRRLAGEDSAAQRSLLFSSLPTNRADECAPTCPTTGVAFRGEGKGDIFRHLSIGEMDEVGDFMVAAGLIDVKVGSTPATSGRALHSRTPPPHTPSPTAAASSARRAESVGAPVPFAYPFAIPPHNHTQPNPAAVRNARRSSARARAPLRIPPP